MMALEQPIKYESRPDPAKYCPTLYAPCNNDYDEVEEEPVPQVIHSDDLGRSGEDLTDNILAVDGVRVLLIKLRQEAKDIKYLDLRDFLLGLVDKWRAFLSSRL
jgi:hypothetical protein